VDVLGHLWWNLPVCDQRQLTGLLCDCVGRGLRMQPFLFQQTHEPTIDPEDLQQPVQRSVQGDGQGG
jgi:hypothetical protein